MTGSINSKDTHLQTFDLTEEDYKKDNFPLPFPATHTSEDFINRLRNFEVAKVLAVGLRVLWKVFEFQKQNLNPSIEKLPIKVPLEFNIIESYGSKVLDLAILFCPEVKKIKGESLELSEQDFFILCSEYLRALPLAKDDRLEEIETIRTDNSEDIRKLNERISDLNLPNITKDDHLLKIATLFRFCRFLRHQSEHQFRGLIQKTFRTLALWKNIENSPGEKNRQKWLRAQAWLKETIQMSIEDWIACGYSEIKWNGNSQEKCPGVWMDDEKISNPFLEKLRIAQKINSYSFNNRICNRKKLLDQTTQDLFSSEMHPFSNAAFLTDLPLLKEEIEFERANKIKTHKYATTPYHTIKGQLYFLWDTVFRKLNADIGLDLGGLKGDEYENILNQTLSKNASNIFRIPKHPIKGNENNKCDFFWKGEEFSIAIECKIHLSGKNHLAFENIGQFLAGYKKCYQALKQMKDTIENYSHILQTKEDSRKNTKWIAVIVTDELLPARSLLFEYWIKYMNHLPEPFHAIHIASANELEYFSCHDHEKPSNNHNADEYADKILDKWNQTNIDSLRTEGKILSVEMPNPNWLAPPLLEAKENFLAYVDMMEKE